MCGDTGLPHDRSFPSFMPFPGRRNVKFINERGFFSSLSETPKSDCLSFYLLVSMLTIHLVDNVSPNSALRFVHYNHINVAKKRELYCDIRSYISENQDVWLREIETWHAQLTQQFSQKTRYWWLMRNARFHAWHPPILKAVLFPLATYKYCQENNINEILAINVPQEFIKTITEIDPNITIDYGTFSPVTEFKINSFQRMHCCGMSIVKYFVKSIMNLFHTKWHPTEPIKRIIYSHIVEGAVDLNRPDHFYGTMLDSIDFTTKPTTLWLYLAEGMKASKRKNIFLKKMSDMNKQFAIIQDQISISDILKTIIVNIRLLSIYFNQKNKIPVLIVDNIPFKKYSKLFYDYNFKFELPIIESLIFFGVKKIIITNETIVKIIYPYEEKSTEKAIELAKLEVKPSLITIGYSHSITNNLHCYYNHKNIQGANPPRPNIIAVPGQAEKNWFASHTKYSLDQITVVGGNHFMPQPNMGQSARQRPIENVLILVGQSYEMNILASYVEEIPEMFNGYNVTIRKYPFGWIAEQECGIERIRTIVKKLNVDSITPMDNQIASSDIIVFNSTSSGIIAMLLNKVVIYTDLHDFLYLDPFIEKDVAGIMKTIGAKSLKISLDKVRSLSGNEYRIVADATRLAALQMYSMPNEKELRNLLD